VRACAARYIPAATCPRISPFAFFAVCTFT
jgi:hypothetical protein